MFKVGDRVVSEDAIEWRYAARNKENKAVILLVDKDYTSRKQYFIQFDGSKRLQTWINEEEMSINK